jgi:hypothetical protein
MKLLEYQHWLPTGNNKFKLLLSKYSLLPTGLHKCVVNSRNTVWRVRILSRIECTVNEAVQIRLGKLHKFALNLHVNFNAYSKGLNKVWMVNRLFTQLKYIGSQSSPSNPLWKPLAKLEFNFSNKTSYKLWYWNNYYFNGGVWPDMTSRTIAQGHSQGRVMWLSCITSW